MSHARRRAGLRVGATLLGIAVSVVFAYEAVREVDLARFSHSLGRSQPAWIAASVVALGVGVTLRAERWRALFEPRSRPPFGAAMRALLVSYLFNNILPARAGEAARVVVLHRETATSRAEVVGTAITERVYDVLSLLIILFVSAPFLPHVAWLSRAATVAVALVAAALLAGAGVALWGNRPLLAAARLAGRLPQIDAERAERVAVNLTGGLKAFSRPSLALPAFALTAASWLVLALSGWLAMIALHLVLPIGAAILVLVATNLAIALPSSPGSVGVFEAATLVALSAYRVNRSHALAYAVVLHAINLFPYLIAGAVALHVHASRFRRPLASRAAP